MMPHHPASPSSDASAARRRSLILVALQFLLIALLVSPVQGLAPDRLRDLPGTLCLLGSAVLATLAFVAMQRHNFTVMPEPKHGSTLVERGPYAHVRHPMYAAVLIGGLGAALLQESSIDWALLALLGGVMVVKSRHEERLLIAAHPGYAAYRRRTAALVPGLY